MRKVIQFGWIMIFNSKRMLDFCQHIFVVSQQALNAIIFRPWNSCAKYRKCRTLILAMIGNVCGRSGCAVTLDELQAACMAAAAYASAVNGVVFDEQEANVRSAAEARENVQKIVHDIPKIKAIMRESSSAIGRTR